MVLEHKPQYILALAKRQIGRPNINKLFVDEKNHSLIFVALGHGNHERGREPGWQIRIRITRWILTCATPGLESTASLLLTSVTLGESPFPNGNLTHVSTNGDWLENIMQ